MHFIRVGQRFRATNVGGNGIALAGVRSCSAISDVSADIHLENSDTLWNLIRLASPVMTSVHRVCIRARPFSRLIHFMATTRRSYTG